MVGFRGAEEADIPVLVEMGREMHSESRFARYNFNPQKYAVLLQTVIPQGLTFVAEEEGKVVGAFVGGIAPHFFGDDLFAYDFLTYVAPAHRGKATGVRLIKRYINIAKAMGIEDIHVGVSAGIATERTARLYEMLGFVCIGGGYVLDV